MANPVPPPFGVDFVDPRTKRVAEAWQRFFLTSVSGTAQTTAPFVVFTADSLLTNTRNLGALATGYLHITTVLGSATPSTTATIPIADVIGPFLISPASSVLAVTANAIAPTGAVHHVGTGLIKTITVPASVTGPTVLHLVPDAAFTYDATGNIGAVISGLAVVGRTMDFTWDGSKWWASY